MKTHKRHERMLLELTSLPTAAGREGAVVAWVRRWAKRRPWVLLRSDRYGNLMLSRRGIRAKGRGSARTRAEARVGGRVGPAVVLAAHMDHPAFVVECVEGRTIHARFLGGVRESYFRGAAVRLWHGTTHPVPHPAPHPVRGLRGVVTGYETIKGQDDPRITVRFPRTVEASPGLVMTWDLADASVRGGKVYAPACDDLAGVAAALAAFGQWGVARKRAGDLRVLLTRAEEVGFIGAIAACGSGIIPRGADIVALENSRSFAESPIGGGPVVRVGDRTSTFDPGLTYRLSQLAAEIEQKDARFKWQRKLMPGGTCEASAYQALGYTATCVCLPLGRYHNMNEDTGRIDREMIALSDFHGLIKLLIAVPGALRGEHAAVSGASGLRPKLDALLAKRIGLLRA